MVVMTHLSGSREVNMEKLLTVMKQNYLLVPGLFMIITVAYYLVGLVW
jgi:hypothetical protein